ncbi:hypothetical protein ACSQ67_025306 [Phaseolus vulgaris]
MRPCEMDTFKFSGPGGQHRNKCESAVLLKNLPTRIIARSSEDRSQHKNRTSALNRLRSLIALKGISFTVCVGNQRMRRIYRSYESANERVYAEGNMLNWLSTGALSRLILSDDSLRKEVKDLRASKVYLLGDSLE